MLTDERLEQIDNRRPYMTCHDQKDCIDEIKRLRSDNEQLKAMLDFTRAVIADYQTPNVDNVTIKEK
jgi:hypothetical protein